MISGLIKYLCTKQIKGINRENGRNREKSCYPSAHCHPAILRDMRKNA